ncbi:SusC/RagA family TonB-linked outer membrane protein [Xanthocytophaga agilis]|uniref:SusC/RagA family TonB-linked outer membrane protein n=1 Tax=Xanthocytophaga agilis TaxID=3048010 RepID=A0AAE3UIG1_9BACT|nr:SusC/RagA family TonB-linked outer membrane protein [Xanthocytophaga agilis]MDJ1506550.1 SusC/RagA family TonB-linked outer membrane protein [Xanthocytophaga agilis]
MKNIPKKCMVGLQFLFLGLFVIPQVYAQVVVKGTVRTETGEAFPAVSIFIKGTSKGTKTDAEGKFNIETPGPEAVLVFTFVGYQKKEVQVGNTSVLEVTLEPDIRALDEVVVTALGIKREKKQLTYSTQEVKAEEISRAKETGVLNSLTGKISGVQITSSTGQPGSSSRIVIRGTSSLLGDNEALIVLDGVPINNSQTGNAGPGNGVSRLSDIDPSIIESINVLKGSAASALYGSSAARGVVMITTKNGSAYKKPSINFTSQFSLESPILPSVQSKYAQGTGGVYYNGEDQKTSLLWGPEIKGLTVNGVPVRNKNPMKEFFQTGKTYTNSLSAQGGSDKSNYLLSYSYLDQTGTVPTTNYKRHSAFLKFQNQLFDNLTSTFQFNYVNSTNHRIAEGYGLESPLWTVFTAPFTWDPKPALDANGNQRVFRYSRNNPYWVLDNIYNDSRNNRFLPVLTLTYKPLTWLTISERVGADVYTEQIKYFEAPSDVLATKGVITDRNNNFRQFNNDLIIEARKNFGPDWDVSLLLGNNLFSTYSQTYQIQGTGLTVDNFNNVSNAERQVSYENYSRKRKVGFYGQTNVEYKGLLNFSLTGRYDGTSVLAKGNNYYAYGSASMGFIFSELLSSVPAINFGKLRLSYSKVGNDNVGPYSLTTPYTTATNFPFNGQNGFLMQNTLGNANLVNENTNEFEVGLEMKLLQNRIGFEASYFDRRHKDLLTQNIPIAPSTGYSYTTLNAGDMTNKGVEVLLNLTPVKADNFSWDVTVNYTKINNKVTRIYGGQDQLNLGQTYAFVGDPYGTFYNYGYKRNEQGRILIDDSGLPLLSSDYQKVGNIQPDWLGGITNTFRYKGITLSFFFDMKKGGDIMNSDQRYGYFYGTPKITENRENRVVSGIRESDGQENTTEVTGQAYYQRLNTIYEEAVQDGTYIKLRNVSLSYNFSKLLLQKTPFATASLTATGRNLWIYSPHFTGADPEVNSFGTGNDAIGTYAYSVPTSRSFNFTLSVTFK